jgi:iron complex outermembrane receptor protein
MKTKTLGMLPIAAACFVAPCYGQEPAEQRSAVDASAVQLAETHEAKTRPSSNQIKSAVRSSARGGALEEIIVTAQKRAEILQDVPISMSVLTGDALDASTVQNVTEALSRVPGVSVNQIFLGGGTQVPVRGVAAGLALDTGSSPTAYYLDSVPFGFAKSAIGPDPDAYDLQRVEVLRGPQGTLYGASALNGVVRVLTMDADTEQLAFKARTSVSETDGGGENYRGDAALNLPIIEGKLGMRAVVGYQNLGGWIDKPNGRDVNDAEVRNMRLKIKAQPTEQLSMGLSVWLSRADYEGMSAGDDKARSSSTIDEPITTDFDAFGLQIAYDFSGVTVTSATSYLDYSNESTLGIANTFTLDSTFDAKTFAQEVNVRSEEGKSWLWSLGSIYRDSKDSEYQLIPGIYAAPTRLENTSKSYAVYGELTRLLVGGRLELTAGLRYFDDEVEQKEQSRFTGAAPDQFINADSGFDATTPRFVVSWHHSDAMTAYASYGEGFRSGSHQSPAVLEQAPLRPAEPDTLSNYEIGVKGNALDRVFQFDAAVYYMDWQDVQQSIAVAVPVGGTVRYITAVVNGDSASGVGADVGLTINPIRGLSLGMNFSWNDLTADKEIFSAGVSLYEPGDRVAFSPEYTAGLSADYAIAVGGNGYEARLSASANYTSETESRGVSGGVRVVTPNDDMLIGRTTLSLDSPEHWTVAVFVDNVNNEKGSPARSGNPDWNVRVRPRTFGLQFEYRL